MISYVGLNLIKKKCKVCNKELHSNSLIGLLLLRPLLGCGSLQKTNVLKLHWFPTCTFQCRSQVLTQELLSSHSSTTANYGFNTSKHMTFPFSFLCSCKLLFQYRWMRAFTLLTLLQLQALVSTQVNEGPFPSHSSTTTSYGFNRSKHGTFPFSLLCSCKLWFQHR